MDWAMKEKAYSQRHACALVGIDPKVYRYRSQRPDDAGLRRRLKELASQRRRFGYRRLHLLLEREGVHVNWKRLYRLYREELLYGSQAWWPEARFGHEGACDDPAGSKPALELGLRVRRANRWPALPGVLRH